MVALSGEQSGKVQRDGISLISTLTHTQTRKQTHWLAGLLSLVVVLNLCLLYDAFFLVRLLTASMDCCSHSIG
jgi:hypothetical protein